MKIIKNLDMKIPKIEFEAVMNTNKNIKFIGMLLSLLISTACFSQTNINNIDYQTKANGDVEFTFTLDSSINKPKAFLTANPPRIAIDLDGVVNTSGKKLISVGSGNTKSLRVVSSNNKSRAVVDLLKNTHHEISVTGNQLTILVKGSGGKLSNRTSFDSNFEIENIDFRRGENGEGRVIISFDKPGATINLRETAEKLKLEISRTRLPESFDNKLDVVDFATPISYIDSRQRGDIVSIQIDAVGSYDHLAYQTGNKYILEISEVQEEVETRAQLLQEVDYSGERISLTFQDIAVRSVLQLIADASQLNIVVADTVTGSVTLRLKNVPWDQALDIVLNSKQLDKRRKGDVIWIAPASEIAEREQLKLQAHKDKEELEPLKTIFIQVNYAKAEELAVLIGSEETGENANSLISDRGTVTFDARTNTLLLTDIPSRLLEIEQLVKALDVAVKQVQIESRIVVANERFGDELGVRFGVNGSRQDGYGNIISTGGSLSGLDRMNSAAINNRTNSPSGSGLPTFTPGQAAGAPIFGPNLGERLNVNLPSASSAASRWALSILAADYLLDLELSALETEGRGEVVSRPSIVTKNQKQATIKQGVQIPYEQASASGATTITFREAVLSLEVTPLITPDDRVDLTLRIHNDSIGENVPTSLGGTVPTIDTRSVESSVLVENGQTIVLGGIYEQIKRTDKSKVPLLGDLPGIGALFRNKNIQDDKAELLIFVTPTIIKENF